MNLQPHLKISQGQISEVALLPGDPDRVNLIGAYLEDFTILASNREFRVGVGYFGDKKITVCSTGIGSPSTAIAVEELIRAGVKRLIRVGTCGGAWRGDISAGSLIIPTASVRDEGTTNEYVPLGFPAVADYTVVNSLINSAKREQTKYFVGINRTHDAFYGNDEAIKKWGKADPAILSSEMESSALFVIASLRGCRAGAVLAVNSDPEPLRQRLNDQDVEVKTESGKEVTRRTVDQAIRVALGAIGG